MAVRAYTCIHASQEDLRECMELDTGSICFSIGDECSLFLRTPAAALHLAHLLRVAAGAEEERTDAPT